MAKRKAKAEYDFEKFSQLDPETDLDENERSGLIAIPCNAVFADLAELGKLDDYKAKWQLTFRHPKGSDYAQKLFAVCDHIARRTWKNEADDMLEIIWGCIAQGISPKQSSINIQDGDIHKPTYNAGHWLIKASRREDEGRPAIYDTSGNSIFEPINALVYHNEEDDGPNDDEEVIGDLSQIVRPGDYCMALIRVWAQAKRDRLNFSLEGVRLVKRGEGAKSAAIAQTRGALGALAAGALPELPAGFGEETEEKPNKRVAAKASKPAKKKAAKKGAKKRSVFR